ncbi:synemin [Colossoma macropomum]|uniref:synemin n=1 Tax=Colossoma macropomum TaxID=42526 RepID=UPI0018651DF2|nr:synemin [Colossoma macropomum]
MFQLRRPFESEKLQLQELNCRLGQYLSRAKLLEQENARLISEINAVRQSRSEERESRHTAELREMRRLVERLSFEKSKAEVEREKLRREFQALQALCSDECAVSRGLGGELRDCEQQLRHAQHTNGALEQRLGELQRECAFLEDAHRKEVTHLRSQVHSRVIPVVTEVRRGPPAVSMEEVEEYALHLSESWMDTLEMYRQKVEEMEEAVKADQARLEDFRKERMQYGSELNRLRAEVEKHAQLQLDLEEQLINMQENFKGDISQYQMIVEELEHERQLLANTISEKLKDHQDLLQVKMGLSLEVAAYRALLEGEGKHAQMRSDQHSRERIIDIKLPSQYAPRVSTRQPEVRRHYTGYDVRYMEPISSIRTSTVSSQFDSQRASRVVPIAVSKHAHQSPAARRDMISFTKATQAAAAASAAKPGVSASDRTKEVMEEKSVKIKGLSQDQSVTGSKLVSTASPTAEQKSVRVVSPPMMSLSTNKESHQKVVDKQNERRYERAETDYTKVTVKSGEVQFVQEEEFKHEDRKDLKESVNVEPKKFAGEEKVLDSVSMEEIVEKVMKPAGMDTKLSPSTDSKITYHVEKTQQEDGSTKTQIVLQSKVEENLDVSDDSALEKLLSKGVKKVSLEDIEGTPTGGMIQNLLSLGLKGESLENKSVNVEIIEEPVESQSDEEGEVEIEETVEVKAKPYFKPSTMFFQIEEPENEPPPTEQYESASETVATSGYGESGSVQVQEVSKEESLPYYSQGQESQEYFVSTPEDNMSESEEGGGFMSYGHYGVVDDLSDERYYQEEGPPTNRRYSDEDDSNRESPEYVKRDPFPQCIIEEEIRVSPIVQESMLEILKEESLDPREQLRGALEQLEGTVSGSLKEELAVLTKAGETSESVSVDIKKVDPADDGTMTFVAELNVSQTLEESGLLDDQTDDLSQEQVLAALQSSNPGLHQALSAGAGGSYTMTVSKEEVQSEGMPWMTSLEETEDWSTAGEAGKTEKVIKLGPAEKSFTFQMDINNSSSGSTSLEGVDSQGQRGDGASVQEFLQTQMIDPSLKVRHEKKIATVYLESPKDD